MMKKEVSLCLACVLQKSFWIKVDGTQRYGHPRQRGLGCIWELESQKKNDVFKRRANLSPPFCLIHQVWFACGLVSQAFYFHFPIIMLQWKILKGLVVRGRWPDECLIWISGNVFPDSYYDLNWHFGSGDSEETFGLLSTWSLVVAHPT